MDIKKKVCDNCKKETGIKEMYLTIKCEEERTYFKIILKYLNGNKNFTYNNLDFCKFECFKAFLEKLLMK